ncbi:hypothetical protein [Microvirga rosea]|uniref:hypothetical protein n=1 Tax=Microvirga rosea TaxID=2715425 RepID=UPI001D09C111|nr:hypothetical protein [Microvirga rosea]MCB8819913.1 hypothetical protein [Microvirga rosea]
MDSDQDTRRQARAERSSGALFDIRERFLRETPTGTADRLLIATMLTLAGLWIGLFSWLGSYAFELSERSAERSAAKPPSLLVGKSD